MDRAALASTWPPTAAVAALAGHNPKSPMQAIREKCLDCTGYQPSEVARCESVICPLWPFRAGKHPYTASALKKAALDASFGKTEAVEGES